MLQPPSFAQHPLRRAAAETPPKVDFLKGLLPPPSSAAESAPKIDFLRTLSDNYLEDLHLLQNVPRLLPPPSPAAFCSLVTHKTCLCSQYPFNTADRNKG